jgi:hypothetical protein
MGLGEGKNMWKENRKGSHNERSSVLRGEGRGGGRREKRNGVETR